MRASTTQPGNDHTGANAPVSRPQIAPRERLMDAAGELFYRNGIGAVGVDLVSKAAGVSKRTLYQQFGSKDELVAASLEYAGQAILGIYLPPAGARAGAAARTPREQILAVFDALRGWSVSPEFRGCPFINTATEIADRQHPARQVARDYKLRMREYFVRQAELGRARDTQQLADQLLIVFDGAIVQAVMDTARSPDAARSAAEALLAAHDVR
jgi:AcrR family transcriptional regulator